MFSSGPGFFNTNGAGPADPYWSQVATMLNFIGANGSTTFTDGKGRIWTPHGSAQISTAQSKWGTSSGYFDGSSWIDTSGASGFAVLTNDATYEAWIKSPGNGAYDQVCGQRDSGGSAQASFPMTRNNTANTLLLSYADGISFFTAPGSATVFDDNWHHVAIVRNGTSLKQYIDGVLDATLTLTPGFSFPSYSYNFSLARAGEYNGQYYKGYMSGFRLTIGVARYTSGFTPPTAPFPNH